MRRRRPGRQLGQAALELALVAPLLLTMVFGLVEFTSLTDNRVAIANAARDGARYATVHATSVSNSATPPSNTIQFQILAEGTSVRVANNNTDIAIKYYTTNSPTFTTTTQCAHYDAVGGTIVLEAGYAGTVASCAALGNLVSVTVTHTYTLTTPMAIMFSGGVTVNATAYATILP